MNWRDHIITDQGILLGKPVIKDTRLSVEHIITLLASGWTEEQLLENYPRLDKEKIQAIFLYIKECMKDGLMFNEPQKSA
jgi:uncharacterized protein (DUF433 family)